MSKHPMQTMTHLGESTCAMVGPLVAGLTEAKSAPQFIFFLAVTKFRQDQELVPQPCRNVQKYGAAQWVGCN